MVHWTFRRARQRRDGAWRFGAAIGGAVGRSIDERDRIQTAHTPETVRTGVPSQRRNPDTGNVYTVTPTRTIESAQGPCREYAIGARIGGKTAQVAGTACRQADGCRRVVSRARRCPRG